MSEKICDEIINDEYYSVLENTNVPEFNEDPNAMANEIINASSGDLLLLYLNELPQTQSLMGKNLVGNRLIKSMCSISSNIKDKFIKAEILTNNSFKTFKNLNLTGQRDCFEDCLKSCSSSTVGEQNFITLKNSFMGKATNIPTISIKKEGSLTNTIALLANALIDPNLSAYFTSTRNITENKSKITTLTKGVKNVKMEAYIILLEQINIKKVNYCNSTSKEERELCPGNIEIYIILLIITYN